MDEELEKKSQTQMHLREALQQLKAENMKLHCNQQVTEQQMQHQIDLINALKQQLSCTIKSHLDEQQALLGQFSPPKSAASPRSNSTTIYLDKQQQHLKQLQLMQNQLATLSITVESTANRGETIDSGKFQQKLQQQLQLLQQEQQEQQHKLLSASSSPLQQSPSHHRPSAGRPRSAVQSSLELPKMVDPTMTLSLSSLLITKQDSLKTELVVEGPGPSQFSLVEIRNLCMERNQLKQQVKQLQQQVKRLQRNGAKEEHPMSSESESGESEKISLRSFGNMETTRLTLDRLTNEEGGSVPVGAHRATAADQVIMSRRKQEKEELPVQGPINREPDEKLYPYKRSTILSL